MPSSKGKTLLSELSSQLSETSPKAGKSRLLPLSNRRDTEELLCSDQTCLLYDALPGWLDETSMYAHVGKSSPPSLCQKISRMWQPALYKSACFRSEKDLFTIGFMQYSMLLNSMLLTSAGRC